MILDLNNTSVRWEKKNYAVQCEHTLNTLCKTESAVAEQRDNDVARDMLLCDGFAKLSINNRLVLYRNDGDVDAVLHNDENVWTVTTDPSDSETFPDTVNGEVQLAEAYIKDRVLSDEWVMCGDVVTCKNTTELHIIAFLPPSSESSFKSINILKYDRHYKTIKLARGSQTHFILKSPNKDSLISYKFSAEPENIDSDERKLAFVLIKMEAR